MRPNETTSLPAPKRMSNPISSPPRLRTKVETSVEASAERPTETKRTTESGEALREKRVPSEPPMRDEALRTPSLPSSLLIGEEAIRKLFEVYGKELERRKEQL